MTKLKLPTSWKDVKLSQRIKLNQAKISDPLHVILSLLGVPEDVSLKLKITKAAEVAERLSFLAHLPDGKPADRIYNDSRRKLSDLSFAEFIDANIIASRGAIDNVHQLTAILYTNDSSYDVFRRRARAEIFLDASFADAWPSVQELLNYIKDTSSLYEGLLGSQDDSEDEGDVQVNSPNEFTAKWGWTSYINALANDDITKHEQVLRMNHIECLNQLAFFVERKSEMKRLAEIERRKG